MIQQHADDYQCTGQNNICHQRSDGDFPAHAIHILKRVPYRIVAKELDIPAYRNIGLALRSKKNRSTGCEAVFGVFGTSVKMGKTSHRFSSINSR